MEYQEVDRAVMEPDVYGGTNMDEHYPQWVVNYPKAGKEPIGNVLELDARVHPPGTQVVVKEPVCPKCGDIYSNCMVRGYGQKECDFDWHKWADNQFA